MGRLHVYGILTCAVILMLVVSCEKQEPARPPGQKKVLLAIHCWEGYAREHEAAFKKFFLETYGKEVEIRITSTTGLESNVDAIQNHGAMLVSPANDLLVPLHAKGLIKPIQQSRLAHYNQINPIILNTNCTTIDGVLFAVPFNFGAYLLAYNKDKVPTPKSYKILWDPKYRKRVTIPDMYDMVNIYMTALMLGFPKEDLFHLSDPQLSLVESKLRELNQNQVSVYWKENLDPEKSGQFDLGMDWGIGVLKLNEKYHANWGLTIPEEGATAWVDTWAITRNVRDKETEDAAYAFIDFMISPESQARMAKVTSYGPINPYSTRYLSANEKKKYYLTDPRFFYEFILWQPLSEEVKKRYSETWRRSRN